MGEGDRIAKWTPESAKVPLPLTEAACDPASDGFAMTNRYIVGPTGQQLSEMDGSGNWLHMNVFADGKLLAIYSGTDLRQNPILFSRNGLSLKNAIVIPSEQSEPRNLWFALVGTIYIVASSRGVINEQSTPKPFQS